jgi:hypothetical protein
MFRPLAISALALAALGSEVNTPAYAGVPPGLPIVGSAAGVLWWEGQDTLPHFPPDLRLAADVIVLPGEAVPYGPRAPQGGHVPRWSFGQPLKHERVERDFVAYLTPVYCHTKFELPLHREVQASNDAFKLSASRSPDNVAFVRFLNHDGTPDIKRGQDLCTKHSLYGPSVPMVIGTRQLPESPFALPNMVIPLRGGVDPERHLAVTEWINQQSWQRPNELEDIEVAHRAIDRRERMMEAFEAVCSVAMPERMCRLFRLLKPFPNF